MRAKTAFTTRTIKLERPLGFCHETSIVTEPRAVAVPSKKLVSVEMGEDAEGRFVVTTYADGEAVRQPVVKIKPKRRPIRPFKKLKMDRTSKKRF